MAASREGGCINLKFLEPDMAELRDSDAEPLKANTADLR